MYILKQASYFKLLRGTSLLGVGEVIIGILSFLALLTQQRNADSVQLYTFNQPLNSSVPTVISVLKCVVLQSLLRSQHSPVVEYCFNHAKIVMLVYAWVITLMV